MSSETQKPAASENEPTTSTPDLRQSPEIEASKDSFRGILNDALPARFKQRQQKLET